MHASENQLALSSRVANQPSASPEVNAADLIGMLRRNWLFPVLGCLLGLIAALTYISMTPALYVSSARILIDRSVNRYLQANKVIDEPTLDDTETGSQLYVLSSESIIVPVVQALNLAKDPEFVGKPTSNTADTSWSLGRVIASAKRVLGSGPDLAAASDAVLERVAVEVFLRRLTVSREDVQSVISVTFSSEDAQKAADIANELADTYLATLSVAKTKSTKIVSQVLQDRLNELKQQTAQADRLLQDFKTANNVTSPVRSTGTPEQMTSLNEQLTKARIAIADAKTRLGLAQQRVADGQVSTSVADNDVILRLRVQYLELAVRTTEMERRVGKSHAAVTKMQTRLNDIQNAMKDEQYRITSSYLTEYRLATARNDELTATVSDLTSGGRDSRTLATLRELESSAELLRTSYNAQLQRFNEASKSDAQPVLSQDARIITRAAPPLRKASRKSMMALGGGIALGLLLGMGAAIAKEFAAGVIRTPDQIRSVTDAYCAILPTAAMSGSRLIARRGGFEAAPIGEHVLQAPYSRFTEALRNVKAMISVERNLDRGRIVGVVSSVSEEGKTTVLTNLAALMASASKIRVLVIDGDLHRQHLTRLLAPNAGEGLIEALRDPSRLSEMVVKNERSGFDLLPCALTNRVPNAAELLGSRQMESLLEAARDAYDFVLVEVPPIMSVADAKMIERYIDEFILVVEWGRTKRRLVQEALAEVKGIRDRLACVVLNKADPAALKSAEAYKGSKFRNYYEG